MGGTEMQPFGTKTTLLTQAVAEIYLFFLMHAGRGSKTSFSVISRERLGLETSYSCQNVAFGSHLPLTTLLNKKNRHDF